MRDFHHSNLVQASWFQFGGGQFTCSVKKGSVSITVSWARSGGRFGRRQKTLDATHHRILRSDNKESNKGDGRLNNSVEKAPISIWGRERGYCW